MSEPSPTEPSASHSQGTPLTDDQLDMVAGGLVPPSNFCSTCSFGFNTETQWQAHKANNPTHTK
jgi:hypothetical protein